VGVDRTLNLASVMLARCIAIAEHVKGITTDFAKINPLEAQVQEPLQEKN